MCYRFPSFNRQLKHARFWDADGNLPSHNHIHIAKYRFSIKDN